MGSDRHIIEKLTLEVAMGIPEAEVKQEQVFSRLKDWMERYFLPELEAALDAVQPPGGQTLRLDRLDIDLGHFSEREFGRLTGPRLKAEVGRLLTEQFSGKTTSPGELKTWLGEDEKTVRAFLFFLENGRLPWWSAPKPDSIPAWEATLWRAFETGKLEAATLTATLRNGQARQRLAGTFSGKFVQRALQRFFPAEWSEIVDFQALAADFLKKNQAAFRKKTAVKAQVWPLIFEWLASENRQEALAPFVARRLFPDLPEALVSGRFETKPAPEQAIGQVEIPSEKPLVTEGGVYVANAGLVLLHPFLQLFFEELKLAESGRLTKPERAVQLLQFLATGRTAPEYELPLNKLLCGLPPEAFVPPRLRLTKKEKAECRQLLEAAIRNWGALKNTSPEGLQGAFLCREGKLSKKPDGAWLLQVEQQTVDVLLDNLPWGIGMVKLPWMPDMLWVEWN